ncbi:MAG: dicarboxylate/amino acid:cation symporter [Gemmatimonadetes bacterium]|nr:dicarboxylate/amino acid:cation symporter [Gemmatimonadota bacterium]
MKESTRVVASLGAAIVIGTAIAFSGSAAAMHAADAVAPLGVLWVNAIRMTVVPLVVSLLITGIASAADVQSTAKLGGRTLLVFFLLLVGSVAIVMPLAPLLFTLLPAGTGRMALPPGAAEWAGQAQTAAQGQSFGAWVTSLIPVNPVAAASTGAMLPLVLFTIFFAIAVSRTPAATRSTIVLFFQAVADTMLVMVRGVILLAPVGVFALLLPLAAHAGAAVTGAIGLYVVIYSLASIVMTLALYPVVAIVARVPLRTFARAAFPPQVIAFTTASSIASLPSSIEAAEGALRIPAATTGFVLPLAVSTFKYSAAVSWAVGTMFVSWFYAVPLHLPQLATVAFAAVFLSFASPGVPGGAFILLAPLLVAVGLPPEGVGLLLAIDAIPDRFATVSNVTGNVAAAVLVAGRREAD